MIMVSNGWISIKLLLLFTVTWLEDNNNNIRKMLNKIYVGRRKEGSNLEGV